MAYKYSVSYAYGKVDFDITPDFGENSTDRCPVGAGTSFSIKGEVTYRSTFSGFDWRIGFGDSTKKHFLATIIFTTRNFSGDGTRTLAFNKTFKLTQQQVDSIINGIMGTTAVSASGRLAFRIGSQAYDIFLPTNYGAYTFYRERVNPSLSNTALTDRHPAISGTDTPYEFFGGFVQGESLPRFETDFTLDSHFPALTARHTLVITQNDVEVLSLTNTTAAGVTSIAFDLDAPTDTGQFTLSYTLRDSAGNTATQVTQFTVYAYSPPTVTTFLPERYRTIPGGTELADDGELAWVTLVGSVAPVNSLNACSVTLTYSHDGGTVTSVPVISGTDGVTLAYLQDQTVLANIVFDARYTYDFVLTVTDMLYTVVKTGSIYKAGGFFCVEKHGVAVGERAKNDPNDKRFDVAEDYSSHFGGEVFAEGGISGITNYSSGEVATGGKWIDGKPIYRYVVVANNITQYNDNNPVIGILPSAPETVISMRGMFRYPSNTYPGWRPLPFAAPTTNQVAMITMRENTREIIVGWGASSIYNSSKTVIGIIEYTKATT